MSLEESLIDKFQNRGILSGEELYLNILDSFDFISACTDLNLAIIGVDFFYIKADGTYPIFPNKNLDCSSFLRKQEQWVDIVKSCNKFAKDSLLIESNKDSSQYCTFVVIEEGEKV
ncbi:hypothetical protein KUV80_10105 [Fictibacillus nanhaiensis]|uniref:hypothetical protein n=1 Tax=Fictibacillus nanhaiensis TaxID=742169 RepID=UPI001C955B92|nr:hypothetical protein [Fictibacillus nanhaiensis]MBY6037010.1 hypothetical protein [Fictibacillus nanhaiensis]